MQKLIKNEWHREPGTPFERAAILQHEIHPEGLDVDRTRFREPGRFVPRYDTGHIISLLQGSGTLDTATGGSNRLHLEPGVHLYLPPGIGAVLEAKAGTELLCVSGGCASQARGKQLLLRDELFLAACASGSQPLRWALTPQYLSRRIFLHHDPVLLSKSGNPVSWFRTTMFDIAGLPANEDGESVFKMSYNSRTEFNVCYDIRGSARVRMAQHPYRAAKQLWDPWLPLDGESTYHLNEAAGGPEEECLVDEEGRARHFLRNKHEVHIVDGSVTLFCLFDPAPTGIENHRPGEYSDYEPLSQVAGTERHERYRQEIARYDQMVDQLSLARAMGVLGNLSGTPAWDLYLEGRAAQEAIEWSLAAKLIAEGNGRERILAQWMQAPPALRPGGVGRAQPDERQLLRNQRHVA